MEVREFPVLLVEDNEDDVLFVRRAFRWAKLSNPLHVVEDGDARSPTSPARASMPTGRGIPCRR
jgi:hypothetical protein